VADGGSRASFEFLQKVDPNGLGRARNIQVVENATAAIDRVASGGADVGFFVQYAERSNPNVKLVQERKLRTVPVVNHELIAAKVADMPVYKVQTFSLNAWSSMGRDGQHTTACTPAVIITGSPESIVDPNDANEQRALFNKIKTAPAAAFLPKEGWLARLISGTRSVPEPALKDMLAAYDAAPAPFGQRAERGGRSRPYEFRRVDNSIWRQLQEVLRTIQEVRGYADAAARKFRS
jgi:hypothetical protein